MFEKLLSNRLHSYILTFSGGAFVMAGGIATVFENLGGDPDNFPISLMFIGLTWIFIGRAFLSLDQIAKKLTEQEQ